MLHLQLLYQLSQYYGMKKFLTIFLGILKSLCLVVLKREADVYSSIGESTDSSLSPF